MGLKEVVERIAGKRPTSQRGSRGRPEQKRSRDEATIQVPAAGAGSAHPSSPPAGQPPVSSQAPPPAPSQAPPPVRHQPAPPAPSPAPPPAAAPRPPPARGVGSADATQYVEAPQIGNREIIGVLVGIDGDLEGEIYRLYDGENKLGRSQTCAVNLLDSKISREHAMIVCDEGTLLILPLSNKNPTYLNGEVLEEGDELSDGDLLRLGNPGSSSFRFRTIEGL